MKRLSSANILMIGMALLLAVSCSTVSFTEKAVREAEALPLQERAAFYEKTLKKDNSLPIFYNLILTLLEEEEYTEAKGWIKIADANHPGSVRLWNAALYAARETKDKDLALNTLQKAVNRLPGDETYASMWMRALRETYDPRATEEALKVIERFPTNQDAINILAETIPFYEKRRKVTLHDFKELDLPYSYIQNVIDDQIIRIWRSLPE